ncbi:Adenylosuccinate lyase @ SAICAR lyase [hydrothermal vent metagenome]|uniref:Adenylosuccinate lyase n=1 Tax=hydrothermal vent metagenome TaxID=652676 RepID=A0A3B1C042_9ZZZZ
MGAVWTMENKFNTWLKIELFACEAWAEKGVIPEEALKVIKSKAAFDLKRIDEIEAETRHDVIAFLTSVSEKVGPESRFIHLGLTSSDVVDTALSALMAQAADKILADIEKLLEVIKRRAYELKDTICVGRSHGIHAEPTSFGLKFALWHAEMTRNKERMERARETISVGKLSGAVGQFGNIDPAIEEYVCRKMGLRPTPISTQVIQRDRHAEYIGSLAILAASIEKIAVELRHLQRTEVLEAEEKFHEGQKGSSAMPHKRNPITAENLTGLARVVKGYVSGALDNVALWHERDISHSSVERVIIPDATILADTMLAKLTKLLDGLTVYPENMMANLKRTNGLVFSQKVLLDLVQAGMSREDAYAATQSAAMRCWKEKRPFQDLLMEEKKISETLSRDQVEQSFDMTYYLRHIDLIYKRVFENGD